jgi:hypothetical protein
MQATAVIKGQFRRSFHHQARPLPLLHISSPVFPRHRLPRYAIQQTRSIGFTSIIRTAFNAARLPVFLGGATVTGLAIANDKLQGKYMALFYFILKHVSSLIDNIQISPKRAKN